MKLKKEFKNNVFVFNIASVLFIQILIKIVGTIYNLFLTNNPIYSDSGNGIFMSVYQIYILFLTFSIISIPVSISKIVSEKCKNNDDIKKVINSYLFVWGLIGFVETIIVSVFSGRITENILRNSDLEIVLDILSVSFIFVNFNAVYRGALNGILKTYIGIKIQFLEQILKVLITILGIYLLRVYNFENRENIIIILALAITLSIIAVTFIYKRKLEKNIYSSFQKNKLNENISYKEVLKDLISISVPITILGIFGTINKNIDSLSMIPFLKDKFSQDEISKMYGIIVSKVDTLINLPIGLNTAITIPLLQKLTKSHRENDLNNIRKDIAFSFKLAMMFAIPSMLIYMFFSKEILNLLYPLANSGSKSLALGSVLIVINIVLQIIGVYYNAIRKTMIVIKTYLLGMIIKVFLNVILVPNEMFLENGILISSIIADVCIIFVLMINYDFRKLKLDVSDFSLREIIYKSIFSVLICKVLLKVLENYIWNFNFLFLICTGISILVYILMICFKKH